MHPAAAEPTTDQVDLSWAVRLSDHAFLISPLARRVLDEEDIVVIDYRDLQPLWSAAPGTPSP